MKALLLVAVIAALFGAAASIVGLAALPDVADAETRVSEVLQAHDGIDTGLPLPGKVAQSVVAIEDRRFYSHRGIDLVSVLRVAWSTLTTGSPQGGATISQQLAKVLYVEDDHTLGAKLLTAGFAIKLEFRYSKAEILEMSLNGVYYGAGHWGIAQASRGYFGKSPEALDWAEASLLAGLLQAPWCLRPYEAFRSGQAAPAECSRRPGAGQRPNPGRGRRLLRGTCQPEAVKTCIAETASLRATRDDHSAVSPQGHLSPNQ